MGRGWQVSSLYLRGTRTVGRPEQGKKEKRDTPLGALPQLESDNGAPMAEESQYRQAELECSLKRHEERGYETAFLGTSSMRQV